MYGCNDKVLENITVSHDDQKVIDEINKNFNGLCDKVKVYVEFHYAQKVGAV